MTVYTAGDNATLAADLKIAAAGDTIKLTAGSYTISAISLNFGAAGVTITSADPGAPATVTQLTVKASTGLTFANLNFSIAGFTPTSAGASATFPFRVNNSTGITFDRIAMSGDPNGTLANTVSGMLVEDSQQVTVSNSTVDHVHTGFQFLRCDGVNFSGNSLQHLYNDGVDFASTSDVTVANNSFTSFHWDATDPEHPDCIQFYSLTGQTAAPTNITITGNTYTRGDGAPVHGIFMNDQLGTVPFTNVLISGNTLTGAQSNGIVIINGVNATIQNNTVISYADQASWIEVKNVSSGAVNNNTAFQYIYLNSPAVTNSGNVKNAELPLPAADYITPISLKVSGTGVDANGAGDLNAGKTVIITLTANRAMWVNGTPYLTLNDGGQATYVGGQGTKTLTFSYTVAAGDNTPNLAVTGVSTFNFTDAAGKTYTYSAINDAAINYFSNPPEALQDSIDHQIVAQDLTSLGPFNDLRIDTTAPTVTAASATPAGPGRAAVITLDTSEAVDAGGSTLALSDGGTAVFDAANSTATVLQYDYVVPAGDAALSQISVTAVNGVADLAGNTLVYSGTPAATRAVTCFSRGVLIATPDGERAVETLRPGDLVLTHEGGQAPVLWLGRQTVSRTFADPRRVAPIRVRAGALGDDLPIRDLLVSPCHALLVEELLVQAGALVNGASIVQEWETPEQFTYYHVELADHALVLAEGVAAETFIDNADRLGFDNWDERGMLFPQDRATLEMDRPRVTSTRQLPLVIRQVLGARAEVLREQAARAA